MKNQNEIILKVNNLKVYFPVKVGLFRPKKKLKAVDDVSFEIKEGDSIGLVGESGSGKTTIGRAIIKLLKNVSGEVHVLGKEILKLNGRELKEFRKNIQIIFQDPFSSLNPRMIVGKIIEEGLDIHKIGTIEERRKKVFEILYKVGLDESYYYRYPHEFSGGQRQRIGIARALVLKPKIVICDEPVSALDVSIQVQVLKLMKNLQKEFNLTYLFIAHDLAVVDYFCNKIIVIYLGKIMEYGTNDQIVENPLHPYTRALISIAPNPDPFEERNDIILEGEIPSPINPPKGCVFNTRCFMKDKICFEVEPPLIEIKDGQFCACHFVKPS